MFVARELPYGSFSTAGSIELGLPRDLGGQLEQRLFELPARRRGAVAWYPAEVSVIASVHGLLDGARPRRRAARDRRGLTIGCRRSLSDGLCWNSWLSVYGAFELNVWEIAKRSSKSTGMSSVSVQFLGSGDAFASGGRFHACLHLDGGAEPLLIDCGATTLVALKRAGIDPASIGWVALSHLHGDHFAGLPWLILDGQFAGRTRPLVIAGPMGTRERFERTFEALYPGATARKRTFNTSFVEFAERTPCELGPALVTPFEVRHQSGAPSYALRIEYGAKVISYSGDTEWTDSLIDVAEGADLFVCECNFFDKQGPGHLDYRTLVEKRAQLGCERIVITHMSEDMLAHIHEADLDAAADGAVIAV